MAYIKTPRAWMYIYSVITAISSRVTVTPLDLYYMYTLTLTCLSEI